MFDIFEKNVHKLRSALKYGCRPAGENTVNIPEPVYVRDLFGGKATIIVFGAPFNWNYAGASREEMEVKNPCITSVIEEVVRKYGIKRAFVPKPAFNAKVVKDEDLPNELLPNFFRGADADGVILEKSGDAYFLASADCLGVAIFDDRTNSLAALHCGRDAVIDRKRILEGDDARRKDFSVINAAIGELDVLAEHKTSADRHSLANLGFASGPQDEVPLCEIHDSIQVYLAAGIRPETFDHPTMDHLYASANKTMIDHLVALPDVVTNPQSGTIDLFALVRHQLGAYRVKNIQEDEFDTATSKDTDGNLLFHSNRRDKVKRNLVIIKLN
jgi:copper oxidase (laccase) domain-containing protein